MTTAHLSIRDRIKSSLTLCLPFIALLGITLAPYFCASFSQFNSIEGEFHSLIVVDQKGNTLQISPSICNDRENTSESTKGFNVLLQYCFFCSFNHTGGLLPLSTLNNPTFVALFKGAKFANFFIPNLHLKDSQSRAPPWRETFSI